MTFPFGGCSGVVTLHSIGSPNLFRIIFERSSRIVNASSALSSGRRRHRPRGQFGQLGIKRGGGGRSDLKDLKEVHPCPYLFGGKVGACVRRTGTFGAGSHPEYLEAGERVLCAPAMCADVVNGELLPPLSSAPFSVLYNIILRWRRPRPPSTSIPRAADTVRRGGRGQES